MLSFSLWYKFRRKLFLNHPEVKSLLYVQKGTLSQVFFLRVVQEFDPETEILTSKVAGAIEKHVDKYSVVSFAQKEIFGDFWTFLNESSKIYFTSGIVLNDNVFQTSNVPSELGSNDIVNIKGIDVEDRNQLDYPSPPCCHH